MRTARSGHPEVSRYDRQIAEFLRDVTFHLQQDADYWNVERYRNIESAMALVSVALNAFTGEN
jgi:hypothetical protein